MQSINEIPPKKRPVYVTVKFPPQKAGRKSRTRNFTIYGVPEDEVEKCLVQGVTTSYPNALSNRDSAAASSN